MTAASPRAKLVPKPGEPNPSVRLGVAAVADGGVANTLMRTPFHKRSTMAEKTRLEALREFVRARPQDPFPRYGMAMELVNLGRHEEAAAEFREMHRLFPDYTAAYYHCGAALGRLGRLEEARAVLRQGIEACRRKGDAHTLSEIEGVLAAMG